MKKKPDHVTLNIYAATIPIQEDGPLAEPTPAPMTILAANMKEAKKQARQAGLTVLGQVMGDGRIVP